MTDVTKIVSYVLDVPGDENKVSVNYTDGTAIQFSLLEWKTVVQKGREAYAFISCDEDYKILLTHENKY